MAKKSNTRQYLKRFGIIFLICLGFILIFNEVVYRIQKDSSDRAPQSIQIVIPEGTADRVAAGEEAPGIPNELTFVAGDVLEVINLDKVDHQLGPLWIPAGVTASLALDVPDKQSYSCSFSPSKYLEIDVRQATNLSDRVFALTLGAPTLAVLVFLYSLAAMPIDGKPKKPKDGQPQAVNG